MQNDDRVPQPVCMAVYFAALVLRVYTGNPLRGVRRRKRLERRGRARRCAMRSAAKRRTREAAIAARPTVAASDVPQDFDKRLADIMRRLRHARRAASLGDVAVKNLRNTVTSLTAKLSSVSETSLRASAAHQNAMRLTRRLEGRLSTVIGALAVVKRARDVALKRGDELERERDDARSSEQRIGEENRHLQAALTVAQEIADAKAKERLDAATSTADTTTVVPLREAVVVSMDAGGRAHDQVARHASLLEANCEDLEEKRNRLLCRVHTLELREREATAKLELDAAEARDKASHLIQALELTGKNLQTEKDHLTARVRELELDAREASVIAEFNQNTARDQAAKCQVLEVEKSRLECRVREMDVCVQEVSAKALLAAADAQEQAARREQELRTSHDEIQVRLATRVQDLEREALETSGKAKINANRLREEVDKCQALGNERDQLVRHVRKLEALKQEEAARAMFDAAEAHQHAARQAQERDASNQQIQARLIARINDLERHAARANSSSPSSSVSASSVPDVSPPSYPGGSTSESASEQVRHNRL